MKEKKVLSINNLPPTLPLWQSVTCWLALEHWSAPQWLYGGMGFFILLAWIVAIYRILTTKEYVDLLGNDKK